MNNTKKPTEWQIRQVKSCLLAAGYLPTMWHKNDIISRLNDREISYDDELIDKIAISLERYHNAIIGINWEVIDIHIDSAINP